MIFQVCARWWGLAGFAPNWPPGGIYVSILKMNSVSSPEGRFVQMAAIFPKGKRADRRSAAPRENGPQPSSSERGENLPRIKTGKNYEVLPLIRPSHGHRRAFWILIKVVIKMLSSPASIF